MNPSNTGFISEVIGWAKSPFNSNGSVLNWILFVGILVIAAWMWNVVLLQLRSEI